jgi:hypothetical protein
MLNLRRLRRERRKRREAKKKAKLRAAQLLLSQGGDEGVEAAPDGETLFSLGAIDVAGGAAAAVVGSKGATKGSKKGGGVDVLSKLASASAPGAAEMELLEEPDSDGMVVSDALTFLTFYPVISVVSCFVPVLCCAWLLRCLDGSLLSVVLLQKLLLLMLLVQTAPCRPTILVNLLPQVPAAVPPVVTLLLCCYSRYQMTALTCHPWTVRRRHLITRRSWRSSWKMLISSTCTARVSGVSYRGLGL